MCLNVRLVVAYMSGIEGVGMNAPTRLLLLAHLLAKDGIITNNGKSFLKEMVLRRDPRLSDLMDTFENSSMDNDMDFLEKVHDLIAEESLSLFNELMSDTTLEVGKKLSKEERDQKNLNEQKSLIYGEVDFASFYRVLRKINVKPGGTFYDLGSGTGKALMAARLTRDFRRCIGIEILEGLHQAAVKVVDKYNANFRQYLNSGQSQHASVYEGSFLDHDWTNGDLVFANSTCFDDGLMEKMSKMAEGMAPGSIFVTFTKGLNSSCFEVLERKRYKMSWGPATVFIHRRLKANGQPVGPPNLKIFPSDSKTDDGAPGSKMSNTSAFDGIDDESDDDDDDDDDDSDDDEDSEDTDDDSDEDVEIDYEDYYDKVGSDAYGAYSKSGEQSPNPNATDAREWSQPALAEMSPSRYAPAPNEMDGLNSPQDSMLLKRKAQQGRADRPTYAFDRF
jgi:hypothetical protein